MIGTFSAKRSSRCFYLAILVVACAVDVGNPNDKTKKAKEENKGATITLRIADGPIETAEKVVFRATGVRFLAQEQYLKAESVPEYLVKFDKPVDIDVLDFGKAADKNLLYKVEVPAGHYEEIRVILDRTKPITFILADGRESLVAVPPASIFGGPGFGAEPAVDNGVPPEFLFLKLNADFEKGQEYSFIADIDLRWAVLEKDGAWGKDYAQKFPKTWDLSPYEWLFMPVSKSSSVQSHKLFAHGETLSVHGTVTNSQARSICFYTAAELASIDRPEPEPSCNNADRWSPIRKSLFEVVGLQKAQYTVRIRDAAGNVLSSTTKDLSQVKTSRIEIDFKD